MVYNSDIKKKEKRKKMNKQHETKRGAAISGHGSRKHTQIRDMVLISLFAALIAVCSIITIPTTVPFTLQTLAVFLAGSTLGLKRGTASVLVYILLGAVGLPVFSQFKSGISAIIGPTGGYIIGFIATVVIVGFFHDRFGSKIWINAAAMALGLLICYIFGTIWFIVVFNQTKGGMDLIKALHICVIPFLLFDAAKIGAAAVISNRINAIIKHHA